MITNKYQLISTYPPSQYFEKSKLAKENTNLTFLIVPSHNIMILFFISPKMAFQFHIKVRRDMTVED